MQIFKDVVGYQGLYQVSNMGNVKSLGNDKNRKEKMLKQGKIKKNNKNRIYKQPFVILCMKCKTKLFLVSRLVYESFNCKIPDGYQVDHINNNPQDNRLQNLQLLTCSENIKKKFKDNPNYKTNFEIIHPKRPIICLTNNVEYESIMDAARQLGIHQQNICHVLKGRIKQTQGYTFIYI